MLGRDALPALAVGTGVAAVTGYMAIAWLIKWLGSHDLLGFAIYRILAGLALLGALARAHRIALLPAFCETCARTA